MWEKGLVHGRHATRKDVVLSSQPIDTTTCHEWRRSMIARPVFIDLPRSASPTGPAGPLDDVAQ